MKKKQSSEKKRKRRKSNMRTDTKRTENRRSRFNEIRLAQDPTLLPNYGGQNKYDQKQGNRKKGKTAR